MAGRPEHGHDLTVFAFDGSNPCGTIDAARRIAFGKELPAASARDRKRDTPISDRRFAVRFGEQEDQIIGPNAALTGTPSGMVAEPVIT
jgi:hypothetical protein